MLSFYYANQILLHYSTFGIYSTTSTLLVSKNHIIIIFIKKRIRFLSIWYGEYVRWQNLKRFMKQEKIDMNL